MDACAITRMGNTGFWQHAIERSADQGRPASAHVAVSPRPGPPTRSAGTGSAASTVPVSPSCSLPAARSRPHGFMGRDAAGDRGRGDGTYEGYDRSGSSLPRITCRAGCRVGWPPGYVRRPTRIGDGYGRGRGPGPAHRAVPYSYKANMMMPVACPLGACYFTPYWFLSLSPARWWHAWRAGQ
jgi:hypothetical protein